MGVDFLCKVGKVHHQKHVFHSGTSELRFPSIALTVPAPELLPLSHFPLLTKGQRPPHSVSLELFCDIRSRGLQEIEDQKKCIVRAVVKMWQ